MTEPSDSEALARLDILTGVWDVEATLENTPIGRATIEWALDRQVLTWSVTIPDPKFPDSLSVVSVGRGETTYVQHYFDARGVARIYEMNLDGSVWTLTRDKADFTPLEFAQRFTGEIAPDGTSISGVWESPAPEGGWREDFGLLYRRVS